MFCALLVKISGERLQDHWSSGSYYHTNSIAMLYLVHKYKKKFESTNMDLTHS